MIHHGWFFWVLAWAAVSSFGRLARPCILRSFSLRFVLIIVYPVFCSVSCTWAFLATDVQWRTGCLNLYRWTAAGVFLSSGSGTENLMQEIRQRSMMIWQCDISPMCYTHWWHVLPYTLWFMNNTRAGTLGFCHHLQAVSTCLVSDSAPVYYYFLHLPSEAIWSPGFHGCGEPGFNCSCDFACILEQVSSWCVHSYSSTTSWNQWLICHGVKWPTSSSTQLLMTCLHLSSRCQLFIAFLCSEMVRVLFSLLEASDFPLFFCTILFKLFPGGCENEFKMIWYFWWYHVSYKCFAPGSFLYSTFCCTILFKLFFHEVVKIRDQNVTVLLVAPCILQMDLCI